MNGNDKSDGADREWKGGTSSFLLKTSVPAGIRLLLVAHGLFALYFLITFAVLAVFIAVDPGRSPSLFIFIAGYHLLSGAVLGMTVLPMWYGHRWAKKVALLGSVLVIGYGALWFFLSPQFSPVAFLFLATGAVSGLYVATSSVVHRHFGGSDRDHFIG